MGDPTPIMSVVLPPLSLAVASEPNPSDASPAQPKVAIQATRDGKDGKNAIRYTDGQDGKAIREGKNDRDSRDGGAIRDGNQALFLSREEIYIAPLDLSIYYVQKDYSSENYPSFPSLDPYKKGVSHEKGLFEGLSEAQFSENGKGGLTVDLEADRRVVEFLKSGKTGFSNHETGFSDSPQAIDVQRLYGNAILFGHDPCPRIVAVEFRSPNVAVEYLRDDTGTTSTRILKFNPFAQQRNQRVFRDPTHQCLTASGRTLFKGMKFDELRRLQLDIETSCAAGYEMSNPERDHILAIAISDSTGWEKLLDSPEEGTMLRELSAIIAERDPDVIEGHNIFGFDLPFILSRAVRLGVLLPWGRDGSPVYRPQNHLGEPATRAVNIAGSIRDVPVFHIHGRHIVDTMLLAALYDTSTRQLPDLKLKSVGQALGVQEPGRVILQGGDIQRAYHEDSPVFSAYALGDVRETRAISAILSQSYFIQAQMFPLSYQDVILAGTATKLNTLLLREYLRAGRSIPLPPPKRDYRGALCELHERGVIRDVWHCDVSSLYPTIMLLFECLPKSDTLNVLGTALTDLRNYRLRAKRLAETTEDPVSKALLNTLQGAFKILINSAYGYLGCSGMNFADYDTAEMVTAIGRNIISRMRDWLIAHGCVVIELDTDGIYFHKPADIDIEALSRGLTLSLPRGIEVSFDRHYSAMFSYEEKNHALLADNGKIVIKGSALRSRSREPYLSSYQDAVLTMLLHGREAEVPVLFRTAADLLCTRKISFNELMKTEELHETLDDYNRRVNNGERNRAGGYEAAIASGKAFKRGDRVSFYYRRREPGEKKGDAIYKRAKLAPDGGPLERDEDIELYFKKLEKVAKQFDDFAPRDAAAPRAS